MDNEKKIKILEKENMRLQAEIDRLNEKITDSRTLQDRYDKLDSLKEKYDKVFLCHPTKEGCKIV